MGTRACTTALIVSIVFYAAACTSSSPSAPTPAAAPASGPAAAAIVLTPNSWDLPANGGGLDITIATVGNEVGNVVAPRIQVDLSASSGELSDTSPRTDATGHAKVTWTGTRSATITARAGDVVGTSQIRVASTAPTPTPTPGPSPSPSPAPTPEPTPTPTIPPAPGPTAPKPAGDLVVTITPTPANPDANQNVTLTVALTSTTGAAVPAIVKYTWDVNNDRLPDRIEAAPVVSYPAGTVTIPLEVITADNRAVQTALVLVIGATPALTATLAAAPSTAGLGEAVTLTATVTPTGNVGTLSYAWDFDGDGTADRTTTTNTTSTSYTTIGAKTPKVTITGSRGGTATASTTVNVTAPALRISDLTVSGTRTAGSTLAFTATVAAASGPVPPSLTFKWEFGNGSEVVTSASPATINHVYAVAGKYTIIVTATAPDGRTATETITITVG